MNAEDEVLAPGDEDSMDEVLVKYEAGDEDTTEVAPALAAIVCTGVEILAPADTIEEINNLTLHACIMYITHYHM